MIEYLSGYVVYENPRPHVRSRHGFFPGMVKLPVGDLLTLFALGEAFEAANLTTYITRSKDAGKSWNVERSLYDKALLPWNMSDSFKPAVLANGSLIAIGYRFDRKDPEESIAIEATGGFQPGENVVSFSEDDGRHWTQPKLIERTYPELIEVSGPAIETQAGDLLAVGALFHLPDGSNPSGQPGVLLRSKDKGKSWTDKETYFNWKGITPFESRICEMQPGRLAVIVWAYDAPAQRHLPNQVVVSSDNGKSWSAPIDTGHMGQSSNLLWLGGDRLLSCHAHRGENPGLYVRIIDFSRNQWKPIAEKIIWGESLGQQTRDGQAMDRMFVSMRFGQPSCVRLSEDEFLVVHWSIECGQGRIRAHHLRIAE